MSIACRSRRLNRRLIVRQNWIVASLYFGLRPRLLLAWPCQRISLSSQTSSEPRALNAGCIRSSWSFGTLILLGHSCRQFTRAQALLPEGAFV
jgi:hypothetical protein